jgi:hypothetical protein
MLIATTRHQVLGGEQGPYAQGRDVGRGRMRHGCHAWFDWKRKPALMVGPLCALVVGLAEDFGLARPAAAIASSTAVGGRSSGREDDEGPDGVRGLNGAASSAAGPSDRPHVGSLVPVRQRSPDVSTSMSTSRHRAQYEPRPGRD